MIYLGIDPGLKGGIAIIPEGIPAKAYPLPQTAKEKYDLLCQLCSGRVTAITEKVQVMGKSFGAKAALSYGQGYGELIGLLTAFSVKIVEVSPTVWKRGMNLGKDKNTSILKAERLFPEVSLYPTPRCKKPSDGLAEALLLAEYGRRMNL